MMDLVTALDLADELERSGSLLVKAANYLRSLDPNRPNLARDMQIDGIAKELERVADSMALDVAAVTYRNAAEIVRKAGA